MIVVTGANGHLGRAVVRELLTRVSADRLVACGRDPAQADELAQQGVAVRPGDFGQPETLATAFAGAEQVLLVSVNKLGAEARQLHRTAIEVARTAGVGRVLYTSHMGTHAGSPFSDHHAAEAVLAEGGQPFTALRHGFYAESALHLIGPGFETGEILAPEDGPISWTTRADLAAADAALLTDAGPIDGITPPLTAPEAFTLADLAAIASEVTGRTIRRVVVTDDEFRDSKLAQGMPEPMVDLVLGVYRDARTGRFAATDPTLATLLGRRPDTMRDVLARTLARP